MRVLYYSNYSHRSSLSQDSAWNLAVEFTKYAVRKIKDEAFVMYLAKPSQRSGFRGDEEKYMNDGNLYILEYDDVTSDGRFSGFIISPELAKRMGIMNVFGGETKVPIVYDILYHNVPYATPMALTFNTVTGHSGIPIICRIDWFPAMTNLVEKNEIYMMTKQLILYASIFPLVVHSKYCLELLRLDEESEEAWNFTKWGIMYPPYDSEMVKKRETINDEPVIIFNHRLAGYTGFAKLLKVVDEISEKYKFKIMISDQPGAVSTKMRGEGIFIRTHMVEKEIYWRMLSRSDAVIGWHIPGSNGWSISVLEAVGSGCYPITHYKGFYPEMFGGDGVLPSFNCDEKGMREALTYYLENLDYCTKKARQLSEYVRNKWSWEVQIDNWLGIIRKVIDEWPSLQGDLKLESTMDKFTRDKTIFTLKQFIEYAGVKDVGQKATYFFNIIKYLRKNGWKDVGGRDPVFMKVR